MWRLIVEPEASTVCISDPTGSRLPIDSNPVIQVLHYFFLNFHPPYRQVKLPNNPKPGVELLLLDSFPLEILPLSDSKSLLFE